MGEEAELRPFPPVPPELRDHILDYRVAIKPEDGHKIANFTIHLRSYLRHHLRSNLDILASPPYYANSGHERFKIKDTKIVQFLAGITEFHAVIPPGRQSAPNISFGEIENVQIHLPFEDQEHVQCIQRLFTTLRRPIKQLKITGWLGSVTVTEFMGYVAQLGQGASTVETLALVFKHDAGVERDEEEEGEDESELCAWHLWHQPEFFQGIRPFSGLVCLKLRTATELFPVLSGPEENEQDWENRWVDKVGSMVPSLRRMHLSHAFSEQHTAYESEFYSGIRIVRYRETTTEIWTRANWCFPARNKRGSTRQLPMGHLRGSRTTQKVHFDAWGSDTEYAGCVESGW